MITDGIERIAVTGGDGLLAKQLKSDSEGLIMTNFSKNECTVGRNDRFEILDPFKTIVHTAAMINVNDVNDNRDEFVLTNIVGTSNLARYCIKHNKRLVYISTDYVYDGNLGGNHSENDPINPYNLYAWSKLGGESAVRFVPNHVIIRTSFGKSEFPYKKGYDNLYTSKDYVDVISPMIIKVLKNKNFVGVVNIGTHKKSMYEYATSRNSNVERSSLETIKDFSLNTEMHEKVF